MPERSPELFPFPLAVFFCPACWSETPPEATRCPSCSADLSALDHASFDEKLERALDHPEPLTARRAAAILRWRRTASAVPALTRRAGSGADPYLCAEIAAALGHIGTDEALDALRELAAATSVVVRVAAQQALASASHGDP